MKQYFLRELKEFRIIGTTSTHLLESRTSTGASMHAESDDNNRESRVTQSRVTNDQSRMDDTQDTTICSQGRNNDT